MSSDITRGPNVCPSCGEANPPTASYCRLCATPLNSAIQRTPSPTRDQFHLPPPDPEQMSRPPLRGVRGVAAAVGVLLLLPLSFFITFVAVCSATSALPAGIGGSYVGIPLGIVAGILVFAFFVAVLRRAGWR